VQQIFSTARCAELPFVTHSGHLTAETILFLHNIETIARVYLVSPRGHGIRTLKKRNFPTTRRTGVSLFILITFGAG